MSHFLFLCFQLGPDRDLWAHPWDSESEAAEHRAADAAATIAQLKSMCVFAMNELKYNNFNNQPFL